MPESTVSQKETEREGEREEKREETVLASAIHTLKLEWYREDQHGPYTRMNSQRIHRIHKTLH